jgi:hypothetical protein
MAPPRTLVIGSTGHQHVTCARWTELADINVVDFDVVVVDPRDLDAAVSKTLKPSAAAFFKKLRTSFFRLLVSDGEIIVIGEKRRDIQVGKPDLINNYAWSPAHIGVADEKGTTVVRLPSSFPSYLSRLARWNCYFFQTTNFLAAELSEVCGPTVRYKIEHENYALNRYGKMLGGRFGIRINAADSGWDPIGSLTVLPPIESLDRKEAVNLVLEDLLSLPQRTLPPDWASDLAMPLVPEIQSMIDEKASKIDVLNVEIAKQEEKMKSIEEFKKLIYASGRELEEIFAASLRKCGGIVTPAKYSEEEFILKYQNDSYLIECKGVGKSVTLTHIRQLFDYMTKFEEEEGRSGKGILLGNAWKDSPIDKRGHENMVVFPDNVVARSVQLEIALVNSVDYFYAFRRFLAGTLKGSSILDRLTSAVGVVDFSDL